MQGRWGSSTTRETDDERAETQTGAGRAGLLPHLRRAVAALPELHRGVLLAQYGGERAALIAREWHVSPAVVVRLVQEAVHHLRRALAGGAEEPGTGTGTHSAFSEEEQPMKKERRVSRRLQPNAGAVQSAAMTILPSSDDRSTVSALVSRLAGGGSEKVRVTPGMAALLLERNVGNRAVSQGRVEVYAQDMRAGAWHLNSQGLGMSHDGRLFDGQHRLLAIMRARVAVDVLVVGGLSDGARGTIDQGRARSLGDNLRILDGEADGHRLSSWLNAIEVLVTGRPKTLSLDMARQRLAYYEASARWLSANGPRTRPLYCAALGGALLYAHRVAPALVEPLVPRYISGADLPNGSPVLLLRNYMTSRSGDATRVMALKVLRALLLELRGERLERLPASEEGLEHFRKLHAALNVPAAA